MNKTILLLLFGVAAVGHIQGRCYQTFDGDVDSEECIFSEVHQNEPTTSKICLSDNPRNVVKVNVGPTLMVSNFQTFRYTYKSRVGLGVGIDYQHLWGNCLGIGFDYLFFTSSFDHDPKVENVSIRVHYIGPSFVQSVKLGRKWRIDASEGIGLSGYIESFSVIDNHRINQTNSEINVGISAQLGVEYMLSDHIGLGLQGDVFVMSMKKPDDFKLKDNEYYGIKRLGARIGVHFYL